MNLQKGRSDCSGPVASPMIKSAKNAEREKCIGADSWNCLPPPMGDLSDL